LCRKIFEIFRSLAQGPSSDERKEQILLKEKLMAEAVAKANPCDEDDSDYGSDY
jgi:hypothetical protein